MYVANISGTVKTYARIVTQGLQWRRNGIQVEGQTARGASCTQDVCAQVFCTRPGIVY